MNHFLDSSSSLILGDKGVAAALLLNLVIPAPYNFPYKPKQPWRFFIFIFFPADCIIQTWRRKKSVWEDEEGFLGSYEPVPAVFLLSEQLQAISVGEEEWLLGAQLVTMLLAVGLGCS